MVSRSRPVGIGRRALFPPELEHVQVNEILTWKNGKNRLHRMNQPPCMPQMSNLPECVILIITQQEYRIKV